MVWYSHLFHNFPQCIVIHTVKGFGIVNKAEIDVFLELSCFFHNPVDVGNLISGSSAFSKTNLNIWNIDILGISKLKWTRMSEFNSDDHYIYNWESIPKKKWSRLHSQQKILKCSTWMQSQKQINDLCLFPMQTTQYHI